MLVALNDHLFLALNASAHPDALEAAFAKLAASWLVYAAALLVPAFWIWGRPGRRNGLLATVVAVSIALGINQLLGQLWFEPRPFMIGLGHTLMFHAVDNSFPSDHATFLWSLGFSLLATGAASRTWAALVCLAGLLVAWARVYLGLHFPIDMAASILVALADVAIARAALPLSRRWLLPAVGHTYEVTLHALRLPPSLFPRGPER